MLAREFKTSRKIGKSKNREIKVTGKFPNLQYIQAFRFIVGPDHCPMISKYDLTLSKAVGPVEPSFLVVKTHFNKNVHLTASLRTPQSRKYIGSQYS